MLTSLVIALVIQGMPVGYVSATYPTASACLEAAKTSRYVAAKDVQVSALCMATKDWEVKADELLGRKPA